MQVPLKSLKIIQGLDGTAVAYPRECSSQERRW